MNVNSAPSPTSHMYSSQMKLSNYDLHYNIDTVQSGVNLPEIEKKFNTATKIEKDDNIFESTINSFTQSPFLNKLKADKILGSQRKRILTKQSSPSFFETQQKQQRSKLGPIATKTSFALNDEPRKVYGQAALFKN